MNKYEQNKLLDKKVSRLIWDISQLSDALAGDPQYDRHWKPRLQRLLGFVADQFAAESKTINEEAAS